MAQPSPPFEHHAPPPLTGSVKVLGTVALSLATFMNVLDSSIANVSIPAISGDLGVSPAQGTWVITSFGVANAIALPLTGWLAQRFGAVRLFVTSVLLFVLASWLCGLAPTLELLVAARVLQGLVAGPMIPLSQTLLLASYSRAQAGTALALWGMTTLVAPVVGPLLGGWITERFSWPWIFYINIPVGLAAAAVSLQIYRLRETPIRKAPIDSVGLGLLVLWVGSLQLMLDLGKEHDWWASPMIVGLGLAALVGLAMFLVWELSESHPVVDLSLFAGRNFGIGVLVTAVGYGRFFGNVVLLPLWLQQWMGYTATHAGMALAPVGVLAILMSPMVGRMVSVWDPRRMASVALLVFGLVFWLRSQTTPQSDLWHIMVPTLLQGAGLALFFLPLTTLTLSGLPPHRLPAAAGLSNFCRIVAGAAGTSITTTLWQDRATLHHARLTESLSSGHAPLEQALATLRAAGMDEAAALAQINRLIDQQAYTRAADDIFLASAGLFVLLIVGVWFTHRPPRISGAPESVSGSRRAP